MRQSSTPSKPSMISTVALQVTSGITTQRTRRKIIASTTSMIPRMALPNTTRSLATKLTISAAIIGTPPTNKRAYSV